MAIFNFSSVLTVLLLFVSTCTFLRALNPNIFEAPVQGGTGHSQPEGVGGPGEQDRFSMQPPTPSGEAHSLKRDGWRGFLWKASRVGERKSEYVAGGMLVLAVYLLLF